jgi:hypothetical protein
MIPATITVTEGRELQYLCALQPTQVILLMHLKGPSQHPHVRVETTLHVKRGKSTLRLTLKLHLTPHWNVETGTHVLRLLWTVRKVWDGEREREGVPKASGTTDKTMGYATVRGRVPTAAGTTDRTMGYAIVRGSVSTASYDTSTCSGWKHWELIALFVEWNSLHIHLRSGHTILMTLWTAAVCGPSWRETVTAIPRWTVSSKVFTRY